MRTLELLNAFSKKELKEVSQIVSGKKKKSLQRLYRELVKLRAKNEEPNNERLFEQAFGTTHSRDKDYLLRNELRLLNEIMYDYLLRVAFDEYIHKNDSTYSQWLLKSFFDRKLKSYFELEIDKGIREGMSDMRPDDTAAMLALKSLWLIQNQPRTPENMEQQLNLLEEWKREEEKRFLYRIREMEAREAFIKMSLKNIKNEPIKTDERSKGQTVFNLQETENNDWLIRYLLLKKHSSQTKGEARIEVLKQMLEIEEAPYFKGDFNFNAQVVTLVNIALENILLERFEEGDKYMEECIRRCEANNHDIPIGNIHNYIANQVNLKRFEKGTRIFEKYERKIAKSRQAQDITLLACFCHLFANQADEAIALVPPLSKLTAENQVISRLIFAIAFFLRSDFNLAYNECVNLKRSTGLSSAPTGDIYLMIVQWLSRFFASYTKDKSAQQKELAALRETLVENRALIVPKLKREFALLWLVSELKPYSKL